MELDYDVLPDILLWAFVSFVIYYRIYKKFIYSILDPVFFNVWGSAFSGIMVVYVVKEQQYVYHYFICQLFFYLGFIFIQKIAVIKFNNKEPFTFYDYDLLTITTYCLFGIYVISNLFVLVTRGSAFFSEDPYARETIYEEGYGIFRRVNWGIGSFLSAALTILYLTKPQRVFLWLIFILAIFTLSEGAKSSLLRVVVIIAALIYHPLFKKNKAIIGKLRKFGPIGILTVAVAFFTVLAKESANKDLFLSFIKRLLSGADSVIYFYLPQNEYLLTHYHPVDYVLYIINPVLGFLHIMPYVEPFGSITVGNIQLDEFKTNYVYLAPNTPFYIEGQIFFGYYGAFIYSFFIGGIFSVIRVIYFSVTNCSYFVFAFMCTIFYQSLPMMNELSLFVRYCLDTCLFSIPVYLAVCLIVRRKIFLRKFKLNYSIGSI